MVAHATGELSEESAAAEGSPKGHTDFAVGVCQPTLAPLCGASQARSLAIVPLAGDSRQAAAGVDGVPDVDYKVEHR